MLSRWSFGEGHVGIEVLEHIGVGVPGVGEDGMSGRSVQRKLGTTRGSPRRSRTAKASRISRRAVKSRCAREWGGWGRLSDDGPGHYNPDPSEGPWGRWSSPPHGGAVIASTDPTLCGSTLKHEGRRQTDRRSAYAWDRLAWRLARQWAYLPAIVKVGPRFGSRSGRHRGHRLVAAPQFCALQ